MTSVFSWQNSVSLFSASFGIPRPNLPVTPGVSWLPTFAFQSFMMKRTSFLSEIFTSKLILIFLIWTCFHFSADMFFLFVKILLISWVEISVLTIWWCPCVESSLLLLQEGVCYDQCILLAKIYWSLPCFILYSKAKFACYSRCFLTSYFCIPVSYNEKDIILGC